MNNGKHVVNHLFFRRKFDLVDDNELAVMLVTNVTNEFEAEAQQSILMGNDQTANFTTANSVYKSQKLREALQKYPEQSFAQKFGLCNRQKFSGRKIKEGF